MRRRSPRSVLPLFIAALAAAPGCATTYVSKNLNFSHEHASEVLGVNRAAVDGDELFVDLVVRQERGGGSERVTLRLPLSSLTSELRLQAPTRGGLLQSWSRLDDRTRVARLSARATRDRRHFPERAGSIPVRRTTLDEFMTAALPDPVGVEPDVVLVTSSSPPSTLLGLVLSRPAWVGTERLLISGVDDERPTATSYAALGGAFVLDVVVTQVALATVFCLLGGCY